MLNTHHLNRVADSWEREQLISMCDTCKTWKEFGKVYISRGYHNAMRVSTTTLVALLVAVDPLPDKEEASQTVNEPSGLSRRGETRIK